MRRESFYEHKVREAIERHLTSGEVLDYFTWSPGGGKPPPWVGMFWLLFGLIGAVAVAVMQAFRLPTPRSPSEYMIGLANDRFVLVEAQKGVPIGTGRVAIVLLTELDHISSGIGLSSFSFTLHFKSGGKTRFRFTGQHWAKRARMMAFVARNRVKHLNRTS
jgi:hypothetical protein